MEALLFVVRTPRWRVRSMKRNLRPHSGLGIFNLACVFGFVRLW